MTDSWWPKRGSSPAAVDDESKGIWFGCLRSLGIRPSKLYLTRHTYIAWPLPKGANLKGLAEYCGTSMQMIEQSCGRYIRKDFLGPLLAARPKGLPKAAVGEKPYLFPNPSGVREEDPYFLRNFGGGGGIENPAEGEVGKKR
jgi:hypothetical protein